MTPTFLDLLEALVDYSDQEMAQPWAWPGHEGGPLQVRDAFWKIYEAESAALVTAPPPPSEAAAIADVAQAAFGDLRGLLAGQPAAVLDAEPGGEEWPLREVLAHVLQVDRSYTRQIEHAAGRADDEPVYINPPRELAPEERAGGPREFLERLAEARAAFDTLARGLRPEALPRPTIWARYAVDVRFRLHRGAAHMAEHTIHAEKVLHALGRAPAEAREAVRRISVLRGSHEFRTPRPELERLDRAHRALAESITLTATR